MYNFLQLVLKSPIALKMCVFLNMLWQAFALSSVLLRIVGGIKSKYFQNKKISLKGEAFKRGQK